MLCDWLELVLRHSFENRSKISLVTKVATLGTLGRVRNLVDCYLLGGKNIGYLSVGRVCNKIRMFWPKLAKLISLWTVINSLKEMVVGLLTTLSSFLIFLQNFLTLFLKGENSVRIIFFLYLLFWFLVDNNSKNVWGLVLCSGEITKSRYFLATFGFVFAGGRYQQSIAVNDNVSSETYLLSRK